MIWRGGNSGDVRKAAVNRILPSFTRRFLDRWICRHKNQNQGLTERRFGIYYIWPRRVAGRMRIWLTEYYYTESSDDLPVRQTQLLLNL
jgi:hypothetical protein